jgi:hypothetical protein
MAWLADPLTAPMKWEEALVPDDHDEHDPCRAVLSRSFCELDTYSTGARATSAAEARAQQ